MSTPTRQLSNLSLEGEPARHYTTARRLTKPLDELSRDERLWEAADHWLSFDNALTTDWKYVRIMERLSEESHDHPGSRIESGDRAFVYIAEAFKDRDIFAKKREEKSMSERAESFKDKLPLRLNEALKLYEEGSQNAGAVFSQLQDIIKAVGQDMAYRCHDNAADEKSHLKSILKTMLSTLYRITTFTLGPGSERGGAAAITVADDSLARIVFIDQLHEDDRDFMLDILEDLVEAVDPFDLSPETTSIAQRLEAMGARDQYRRRFLAAVRQ